jgi:hypothetical protein
MNGVRQQQQAAAADGSASDIVRVRIILRRSVVAHCTTAVHNGNKWSNFHANAQFFPRACVVGPK